MSRVTRLCAVVVSVLSAMPVAQADPITIDYAGYYLNTVGVNTIGTAGGGTPDGVVRTLFVANTTPSGDAGTTATASLSGAPVSAPSIEPTTREWVRAVPNPTPAQSGPLTVSFANGADTASYSGASLVGLTAMPLAQDLGVNAASEPFGPLVTWALPANAGDVDAVWLVFYNNVTNAEVGTRVLLPATATSYDIVGPLPQNYNLVVNVRLVDLREDAAPFAVENIQRDSRAYINYLSPVPEASSWLLLALGLAGLAVRRRVGRR